MSLKTRQLTQPLDGLTRDKWTRRRDIPLAILAWIAVVAVIFWAASHIIRSILLLVIAALLAYALAPAVKFLQRFMPRFLAILIVYLIVFSGISLLLYLIVSTTLQQVIQLSHFIRTQLTSGSNGQLSPLEQTLISFGIPQSQIADVRQQVIGQIEGFAKSAVPFLTSVFNFVVDTIVMAVLSIYLLIDGERVNRWLRANAPAPQQQRIDFLLDTLERIIGGYIRGQLFLAALIGVLVGGGMALFGVPYAILLGVLAFVLAFVPVLGTFISGAACVLLALTKGWLIAVLVLGYFVIMHVLEGDILGPRIVGKAIGIHPIVSLTALIAGAELFGIWGALFASPLAGLVQALLVAFWKEWRETHPEQFEQDKEMALEAVDENLADKVVSPSETVNP